MVTKRVEVVLFFPGIREKSQDRTGRHRFRVQVQNSQNWVHFLAGFGGPGLPHGWTGPRGFGSQIGDGGGVGSPRFFCSDLKFIYVGFMSRNFSVSLRATFELEALLYYASRGVFGGWICSESLGL